MNKTVLLFLFLFVRLYSQDLVYSITDFGVKASANVAVTREFDAAMDKLCLTGGTLVIPAGNYILDNKYRVRTGVNSGSYIFLIKNNIKIILDKDATLIYKNGFKGFRFRSLKDPTPNSEKKYSVQIIGGTIDGSQNWVAKVKNNPNICAFVGEFLQSYSIENLKIKNLYGTAGIGAYRCENVAVADCVFNKVTGNPEDFVDNHGDGVYNADCTRYTIFTNTILNDYKSLRMGRVGICIEYEGSKNGEIYNNKISGYDRGIHVELIKGSAIISENILRDNSTGITLWNNYGNPPKIKQNTISYIHLPKNHKPLLYTSAPILMLGADTNKGSRISSNIIDVYNTSFLPQNIIQITSSNVIFENNTVRDQCKSLSIAVAQGGGANNKINNIIFNTNNISTGHLTSYDSSIVQITNNKLDVNNLTLSFDESENKFNTSQVVSKNPRIKIFGKYN